MKMKKILALALAGAMVLSVVGCSPDKSKDSQQDSSTPATGMSYPGTKDKDMVTVDLRGEPAELNSILSTDVPSKNVLTHVISGLYALDADDKPVPDLAEDTKVSEDGKTYTLKLRQDSKWSNGEPVTAHDFVYSWQQISTKEVASVYGFIVYENLLNGMEVYEGTKDISELGVKALDDYTLEVTFVNPLPYALHLFAFSSYFPMNKKAYEEIGSDKYAKDADKIVTNGPYKIDEWVHDDHITLAKNEDWYNADKIEIPKIKYLMMKDANARMNAFKAGEVDSINLTGEQMEQAEKEGINVKSYIDNSNWYLQYNTQKKELSSAKIRQALGMSVDTQAFCENVLKDGSVPATGVVPNGINGADNSDYTAAVGDITVSDKEKAKKLFEEGLTEIGMDAENYKLSLIVDDTSNAQRLAAFLQDQFKQALEITVDIKPMPFKSRLAAMQSGDFDIAFAGWSPDYNDAMTYLDMFVAGNGNNYGKYSNAEFDKLIADAIKEADDKKRQEMLIEAEKILVEQDAPVSVLYFQKMTYALSDKIEGMVRTGFQEFDFTNGATIVK